MTFLSFLVPRGSSFMTARRVPKFTTGTGRPRTMTKLNYFHSVSGRNSLSRPLSFQDKSNKSDRRHDSSRPLASSRPSFDAFEDDQGFGAYDYVPDDYDDWDDMMTDKNRQEFVPLVDDPTDNIPSNDNLGWEENNSYSRNQRQPSIVPKKKEVPTIDAATAPKATTQSVDNQDVSKETNVIPEELNTPKNEYDDTKQEQDRQLLLERASRGMGMSTDVDRMEEQLDTLQQQIVTETENPKFNPNSPRQVSEAMFGIAGESTNKEVLEAIASSSKSPKKHLADLILQFRRLSQDIKKRKKMQTNKEQGTYTRSVHTVKRPVAMDNDNDFKAATSSTTSFSSEEEQEEEATSISANPKVTKAVPRTPSENPLVLVDASAYIFRAYYAYPPLHRSDGMPIGAVLGFCNMLNKLVLNAMMEGKQPRVVLVFDAPGKTFRHGIYQLYKANRAEAPVDLIPQFGLIRQVAKAYGMAQIEAPTYEADDVIATMARMAIDEGLDCNILSGDKDLMQLITPTETAPCVQMIDPMTMARVTYEDVIEKWGVPPEKLGDVLALAGDSSDNIPGVPGIGPKIAAGLIDSFGSLDNLLENIDDVKQKGRQEKLRTNAEQARLSRVLVDLEREVPMGRMTFPDGVDKVSELRMGLMDPEELVKFFDEMGLRDLKFRFEQRLQRQRGIKVAARPQRPTNRFAPRPKAEVPRPEDFEDVPF